MRAAPLLAAGALLAAACGVEGAFDAEERAETRALFDGIAADEPGCSAAVARDGELEFVESFGAASLDPVVPLRPDMLVDIASTSKQFTATAILLLAEDGALSVDDHLDQHLPGLASWAERVTIANLLHHDSGIPDYIGLLYEAGFDDQDATGDAEAIDVLAAAELDFEPGARFEYSNSNYFLLGQVVRRVAGVDLATFLEREVFEPLDMDAVMDPTYRSARRATSYHADGDGWVVADSPWAQTGDGGIQTTPSDLVRWAAQYWDPTIGGDAVAEARFDGAVDGYGAGIGEAETDLGRVLHHAGLWAGFVTTFNVLPSERLAAAVTCTTTDIPEAGRDLAYEILEIWAADR